VPFEANTGANKNVYFVCNYLGGPFTQLPFVTPDQIKVARQIKKFLTGRLTSHVSTYPLFPGTEANYLRAQIARIAANTVCAPSGLFSAGEDGSLEKSEEFGGFPGRELAGTANWVHRCVCVRAFASAGRMLGIGFFTCSKVAPPPLPHTRTRSNQHLKKQGRCELFKREPPEGEEDTFEPTEEEQEEGPEPLAGLDADSALPGEVPAWTPLCSSASEAVRNQVGGVRSNLWPGAYVVGQDKRYANVYVGWGVKSAVFVPVPPPPVATEYDQTLVESLELPPKPAPPAAEGEGGEGGDE
jgi:hypothetical protein